MTTINETELNQAIQAKTESLLAEFEALSQYIYANPELGLAEFKSSQAHVDLLEKHGFSIEKPYLGFETAFRATYASSKPGPTIALLSEYDALPGIGHGCGHNLLGATDTGAGIVLRYFVDTYGGTVVVLGTPAEETNGVKVDMAAAGTFDDIDIALCTHPSDNYYESGRSMAMEAIEFRFHGKTAHAASNPFDGVNALDGVLQLFTGVSLMRQQMHPTARVHGIISDGGKAANIIPDYAAAQFYIRAQDKPYLAYLHDRIIVIAEAAAQASGTQMEWFHYEKTYLNLQTNPILSNKYNQNMAAFGIEMQPANEDFGSLDMGDVSQVVPAINPYYGITGGKAVGGHTVEFREWTLTPEGVDGMRKTINALVKTSLDVITQPDLLAEIKASFAAQVKG
ncbi:M20 family metallopeptidase [Fundicoccus culcitae]|uniref:Peptidase M20 domain-containing protein 2 n=1 Tax=Fundicoccus culcitae TaxID=2969821 RepID=A0ABY5P4N2_9LACT|nr:M20 family metallopeptidase [Fundicoccus culcitae]UUX33666.1 M20 family metallopeptidase [Fundicoccus culcitae]